MRFLHRFTIPMHPTPAILKSEPITDSEKYLRRLCDRTFLSLWTYPGVYRDQGKSSQKADGKEVCDIVVVFQNHVILFSDKSCEFTRSGNWDVDWQRWYRKAIKKSADQLWGAERWIREFPGRLYLDRACTQPFPITLPAPSEIRFHRIAVARGAAAACREYFGSGTGSLMVYSATTERAVIDGAGKLSPFAIGDLDPKRGYIHVFDDITLDVVLGTLDTVSDFVQYLAKKERFVRSLNFSTAAGEEELLAFYFQSWNPEGELDFYPVRNPVLGRFATPLAAYLGEGGWNQLTRSETWDALQAWREPSYYWDYLIERFSQHTIEGTLYAAPDPSPRTQEELLRFLAAEPRYRRRVLAAMFLGQIHRAPLDAVLDRSARVVPAMEAGQPTYIFLVVGREDGETHDEYRVRRRELLDIYALAAKDAHPQSDHIIAIGVEAQDVTARSEDIIYLDGRDWTDEMRHYAHSVRKEFAIFKDVTNKPIPEEPRHYGEAKLMHQAGEMIRAMKVGRNETCPCGSGKKFKRCHGIR